MAVTSLFEFYPGAGEFYASCAHGVNAADASRKNVSELDGGTSLPIRGAVGPGRGGFPAGI
jgi:hypothetical protein